MHMRPCRNIQHIYIPLHIFTKYSYFPLGWGYFIIHSQFPTVILGGSGSGVREWVGLVFDDKSVCGENSVEVSL